MFPDYRLFGGFDCSTCLPIRGRRGLIVPILVIGRLILRLVRRGLIVLNLVIRGLILRDLSFFLAAFRGLRDIVLIRRGLVISSLFGLVLV